MAVIIKAYLELPGNDKPEIRRFSIDRCATFANLNRKLEKAFPSLDDFQSRVEFQLYWKDSEGDEISLSTNAELSEALDNVTDNVLKIYIKVKPTPSNSNDNGENVFHPNVTCDGCQGAIYGIRYKCMICFDYDLCNTCESKGIHNEHPFARIKTPGKFPPFAPPMPPPFHFGMFGHRGGGKWFGKWQGNCYRGGRWNHHQHRNDFGANQEAHFEHPTEEDKNQPDFQDFLKNVGETVKAYLDPLGIDVQVDVEHGKERQCAGCGSSRNDPTNSHQSFPAASTPTPTTTLTSTATTTSTSTSTATSVPIVAASPPATAASPAASTNLTTGSKTSPTEGSNQDVPDGASPGNSTEDMDCDWTYVIHKEAEPDGNGAKKVIFELKQSKTGSSSELISDTDKATEILAATSIQEKPERPIRHSNPAINDALYIMEEMGFNDDGGWLTVLLEAKNGNIAKVLDALQPSK